MIKSCIKRALAVLLTVAVFVLLPVSLGNEKVSAATTQYGLTQKDGTIYLNGKPYYAMGVNFYDAFIVDLRERGGAKDVESEFAQLKKSKIPVVRIQMCAFYPEEFFLYMDSPDYYFEKMDKVIRLAEKYQIGIVMDLFWLWHAVADACLEDLNQIGNPNSQTVATSKKYATDVVKRYRKSPAVWAWELGNEYNLAADLEKVGVINLKEWATPGYAGCQSPRTQNDIPTSDDFNVFYKEVGKAIRALDPYRLITGGDSEPRGAAYHLRESGSWQSDSFEQMEIMMKLLSPAPLNMMSVHVYQDNEAAEIEDFNTQVRNYMRAAKNAKQALFVGEFGIFEKRAGSQEKAKAILKAQYDAFMNNGVQLSCIWVYGKDDGDEMNISPINERAYQYNVVVNGNVTYREQGKQDSESYWKSAAPLLYKASSGTTSSKPSSTSSGKSGQSQGSSSQQSISSQSDTSAVSSEQPALVSSSVQEDVSSQATVVSQPEAEKPSYLFAVLVAAIIIVAAGIGVLVFVLVNKKKNG